MEYSAKCLDKSFRSKVKMPCPMLIEEDIKSYKGKSIKIGRIYYEDVCQKIVCDDIGRHYPEAFIRNLLHDEENKEYATKGVTFFNRDKSAIKLLIYVREKIQKFGKKVVVLLLPLLVAYMAVKENKSTWLRIIQPSGDYVLAEAIYEKGEIKRLTIEEEVFVSAIGTAFISLK